MYKTAPYDVVQKIANRFFKIFNLRTAFEFDTIFFYPSTWNLDTLNRDRSLSHKCVDFICIKTFIHHREPNALEPFLVVSARPSMHEGVFHTLQTAKSVIRSNPEATSKMYYVIQCLVSDFSPPFFYLRDSQL